MSLTDALQQLSDGEDLSSETMDAAMSQIMQGEADPAQIGGLLMGLAVKGETVDEISAAALVMRRFALKVQIDDDRLIDTCGTGGDGMSTFNVSTACAFVAAEAGARVAKHGNRSVSSKSGSADVLEAAGFNIELTPEQVAECVEEFNIGFLFAQAHHQATRHAASVRKALGVRTLFNLLGPLTNPAGARRQVLGVFNRRWVEPVARVLQKLGSDHILVVHSRDGMDEISIAAPTWVSELRDGEVRSYEISPRDVGLEVAVDPDLGVDTAEQSLAMIERALTGENSPVADIVSINSGAAIYVAGLTDTLQDGVRLAQQIQQEGTAWGRLKRLAAHTQQFGTD